MCEGTRRVILYLMGILATSFHGSWHLTICYGKYFFDTTSYSWSMLWSSWSGCSHVSSLLWCRKRNGFPLHTIFCLVWISDSPITFLTFTGQLTQKATTTWMILPVCMLQMTSGNQPIYKEVDYTCERLLYYHFQNGCEFFTWEFFSAFRFEESFMPTIHIPSFLLPSFFSRFNE